MSKIVLLVVLLLSNIYGTDSISSFSVIDEEQIEKGNSVDLSIDYTATKKHQLKITAYDKDTNTELAPNFSATDTKHISYDIPSDAESDIKLVLGLIEDGASVDSKELTLDLSNVIDGLYFCSTHSYDNVQIHPTRTECFEPLPDVEYELIHGDDPGAAIFISGNKQKFKYSNNTYNLVVVGNSLIHYYANYDTANISAGTGWSCYSGCCTSTSWGTDDDRDCLNSRDTEDRIFATYESANKRIKIVFRGGYYSCSCSATNCCGESKVDAGYVYFQ